MKPLARALGVLLLAGSVMALTSHRVQAAGPLLTMSPFATNLTDPVGVDAHYTAGSVDGLTVSVNHQDGGGGFPNNFAVVPIAGGSGPYAALGTASGIPDEICIATVNPGQLGGWTTGDMFVTAGVGKVNRLSPTGVLSPFATVANAGATDFIRGDMTFDNTGLFQNSLLAASRSGIISEIASNGSSFTLATVGVEIEGLAVIPNSGAYGPWAGKLIATSPTDGKVYVIAPDGTYTSTNLGIPTPRGSSDTNPNGINDWESAHVIPAGADFYQVEYNHHELLTLTSTQLAPYVGQILLVQEATPAQLWLVNWDPTANGGLGAFTHTLLAEPRDPGDTSSNGNYNFEQGNFVNPSQPPQQNEPFYTATQGGWGQVPKGNNVGTFLAAHFSQAFPSGVTIGTGSNTATFTSQLAVQNFLPAGGKFAAPLSGALVNPTSTTTGEFAGQVLSATIAVGFSKAGITQAGLGNLTPVSGPLAGVTINDILVQANRLLAGLSSIYSRGDMNTVLSNFNANYDGGTVDKGGFH